MKRFGVVVLGLPVIIAVAALAALLQPAPVDGVASGQAPPLVGTFDYTGLRAAPTATPARIVVTDAYSEWIANGDTGDTAVIFTVQVVQSANPLRIPPVLKDHAGTLYPATLDSLETARRLLLAVTAGGEAQLTLVFPSAPSPPLTLALNPGSADEFAPEVIIPVPTPEPAED